MLLSWAQCDTLRDIVTVSAESQNTRHDTACSDRVTCIALRLMRVSLRHSVWVCVFSDPGLCLCSPPDISHYLIHKSSRSSAGILASNPKPEASLEASVAAVQTTERVLQHTHSAGQHSFSLPQEMTDSVCGSFVFDESVDIVAHSHLHMLTHGRELVINVSDILTLFMYYYRFINILNV